MFPRLQNRINSEMVLDKVNHLELKTGDLTYQMEPYDHIVVVTNTSGAGVITLPAVADAAGKMYLIYLTDDSGTSVDIKSKGDEMFNNSVVAVSDGTSITVDGSTGFELATAGEFVLLFCTGLSWHILDHVGVVETT